MEQKVECWSEQAARCYYQTGGGDAHPPEMLYFVSFPPVREEGNEEGERNEMLYFVSFPFFISFFSNGGEWWRTCHISNLSAVCSVYYSFVLSSLYHAIGQRSMSGRGERKAKDFGRKGMSKDEMTI